MKTKLFYLVLACLLIGIATLYGCKKDPYIITLPTVSTVSVSGITLSAAVATGIVTFDGGIEVIARGVCWSTVRYPSISDNKTTEGKGSGAFTSNITGLVPNTTYYVRTYATNSVGTTYGNEISFTSEPALASTVTTADIVTISSTSAVSGGEILSNGGAPVTYFGICWSTSPNPDLDNWGYTINADDGKMGVFIGYLSGLNPSTVYFVRAFAMNSSGVTFGNQLSFKTSD
jgi:hypothetical protein